MQLQSLVVQADLWSPDRLARIPVPDVDLPRFPDGSDFSTGIIKDGDGTRLRDLLRKISEAGSRDVAREAIRSAFFTGTNPEQQLRRANNVLIALNENNYGLVNEDLSLTAAGRAIRDAVDEEAAVRVLASHIVRDLCGQDLLRAIRGVAARGDRVNKQTLTREMAVLGYAPVSETSTNEMQMVRWLRRAGVLDGDTINHDRLRDVAGVGIDDIEAWADLDEPQRAFLRAMRQLMTTHAPGEAIEVDHVYELVEQRHGQGVWQRRDQRAGQVIHPLEEAGWLVAPEHAGRGARAGQVEPQDRLAAIEVDIIDRQVLGGLPTEVRARLNMRHEELQAELDSDNRDVAGRALEVLAAKIMIDLGLTGIQLRVRDRHSTGGAEIDLLAEAIDWTYERWIVQCKNTTSATGVDVVTREVGVAVVTDATVIVLISRGGFTDDARAMVAEVARRTPYQIVMLEGTVVENYLRRGIRPVLKALRDQAGMTARRKRSD